MSHLKREFAVIIGAYVIAGALTAFGTMYLVRSYAMEEPDTKVQNLPKK